MSIKSVSPQEASTLLEAGAVYVDVRTEPEFEEGHPPGSFNVPLSQGGVPNPDFLQVMQHSFGKNEKLVMGCRSGARSLRAAEMLLQAGYTDVSNLSPGWEGSRDAFGRTTPGWRPEGLPVELGKPAGQRYDDVKRRTPK